MQRPVHICSLLLAAVLLIGCEGETTYNWYLKNDSTQDLTVELSANFSEDDTLQLPAGNTTQLLWWQQRGGNRFFQEPATSFHSLVIHNGTDTVSIDPLSASNWRADIDRKRKVPAIYEHDYVLTITDQDF